MLGPERIPSSEITPPEAYFNRRSLMRAAAAAVSLATTATLYRRLNRPGSAAIETAAIRGAAIAPATLGDVARGFRTEEPMTPLQQVGNYNNFYEFTTDKEGVAAAAAGFVSRPWTVDVGGLVRKPKVFDLDEILKLGGLEERVYRMRCVEGWSMVIPWAGLPLARLIDRVEPMGDAKYVAFQTLVDPARFPGQRGSVLRLALRRGPAAGRGDAPAHHPGRRPLRPRAAGPERGAVAAGDPVEIRVQGDQVDRPDHAHRRPAALDVEPPSPIGIWVFLKRQSGRPPPQVEPGDRTADR